MNNYISYSSFKCYNTCPKKYWFSYISKPIIDRDPRNALFGLAIGRIFEIFYNENLWKREDCDVYVLNLIDTCIGYACSEKRFDVSSDQSFLDQIKSDLLCFVPKSMSVIRKHKLLSMNSHSEVKLNVDYSYNNTKIKLGGRADFIHYIEDQVWIIDGKGSKYREQYTDTDQLVWYAIQHYLKYQKAPARLGFWYYRFYDDPIQWVQYDADSMRSLLSKAMNTISNINSGKFVASTSFNCEMCDYKKICDDGKKFLSFESKQSSLDMERI
jgi:CRISPR/Cas system-associated exonuclease Cas4 (RecB family)